MPSLGRLDWGDDCVVDIKTERLSIRPFTLDDAPFILRLLNEPSFIENIADKGVRDLDGARSYLRDGPLASYERHGFGLWRVGLAGSDTPIGMAGLLKRDFLDDIDIGYALLPEFCGAGYAFEATSAVLAYAGKQLGARRVVAIVADYNERSISLLKKLGFADEGTMRMPGEQVDLLLLASAV
ncbi:MAG: GNAT family N-acetyltransferase [Xanthomonadales bacterium]|jgi:RimJ/RimL family protein N-acetyltransferase|nr:GNAT family N-acetyltransferase [Xanthomonadales bacterium]